MKNKNTLFIFSNGRVAAINKKDGTIIWEVKVKQYTGSVALAGFGTIHVEGDKIYIGVSGILLCLLAKDGSLVWKNELKGWGYSLVSMANVNNETIMAAANAAAVAASTAAV